MKLRRNSHLEAADAVLALVERNLSEEDDLSRVWVECYCNGREQGYCISTPGKIICFSEYRNSDAIVVYVGDSYTFSMQGNVPDEKAWKNAKHFEYNQSWEAAEYIVEVIRTATKESKQTEKENVA